MDHRQSAQDHITALIALLKARPPGSARDTLISECESLVVAIRTFHMEGIRFRMFNVDRLLSQGPDVVEARSAFAAARRELEAAGFYTRSHQAPG
jgi:hypothetical protein